MYVFHVVELQIYIVGQKIINQVVNSISPIFVLFSKLFNLHTEHIF